MSNVETEQPNVDPLPAEPDRTPIDPVAPEPAKPDTDTNDDDRDETDH